MIVMPILLTIRDRERQLDHCRPLRPPNTNNANNTTRINTAGK